MHQVPSLRINLTMLIARALHGPHHNKSLLAKEVFSDWIADKIVFELTHEQWLTISTRNPNLEFPTRTPAPGVHIE